MLFTIRSRGCLGVWASVNVPKHGWKWRVEQVKKLTRAELERLIAFNGPHLSARMARWIYENLLQDDLDDYHKHQALERIGWDDAASWSNAYLWRELEKHKGNPLGDWIIVALTRPGAERAGDAERFIEVYEDETAHPS